MDALRKARVAVLEELGSVPVIDLEWFMLNILPTDFAEPKMKNDWDLDDVLKQLTSSGAWEELEHWKKSPTNIKGSGLGKDHVFQGFQTAVDEITNILGHPKASSPFSSPSGEPSSKTSYYLTQPNKAPVSVRDNKSRPDGYFRLINANAEESDWWNIICPVEFKRSDNDAAIGDDVEKIIWSLHHIMREDARRRFTFGITIEDTQTRFWFASRSIILVTKPFDFMTEPKPLVQMVNFLTYASEEQLGYDTTMHRVPNSAGELVIKIGNRWFQTKELLADFSADSLLGRGTRVWRGFFLDAPEAPAVFKDCWAERDCRLEGDVLETLRGEYAKLGPTERNFDDYFLTTIEHGTAKLSTGVEDNTQAMMNNQELPKTDELLVLTSFGLGPSPQEVTRVQHRSSRWRRHYRISFNEVGTPLCDVVELKDHLRALRDAMIGIEILHKLGYVHRDVSSGNVLLCEERGKLSDLEYCKPFSEVGEHEARIGTCYFMSMEVATGYRLFSPDNDDDENDGDGSGVNISDIPPFQFFILHDIESVWWLLTFALFANGVQGEQPDPVREDRQVKNAYEMFPTSLYSTTRQNVFVLRSRFLRMRDSLPSILHPLFNLAEALRKRLIKEYRRAELTDTLDQSAVPHVISHFQKKLDEAIGLSENITLVPGLKFDRKRPAEEAGEDGGKGSARKMSKNV